MGEAKRRKQKDPNYGKRDRAQSNLTRSQILNLNEFLGAVLGQLLTKSSNLVGDVEVTDQNDIKSWDSYKDLKLKTEELLDYIEEIQKQNTEILPVPEKADKPTRS